MIILGFFTGKFLSQGLEFQIFEKVPDFRNYPFPIIPVKRIVFIFTTISLLGILGKNYLIIEAIGGLQKFILNPSHSRQFILEIETGSGEVNIPLYKMLSYMSSFVYVSTLIGGLIYTVPRSKLISFYPLVVSFLAALLTLQRAAFIGNYVSWLICAFIFIYFQPKSHQQKAFRAFLRQILYFIIVFILFSLLILLLRYLLASPEHILIIINSFYIYIAGNIWLLDTYLLRDKALLYGLSIFRSIVSWFSAFELMDKTSIISPHYEFYPIHSTLANTFTYIRVLYEDFGIIGLVAVSYLWGLFSFSAVKVYLKKFTFLRAGLVAVMVFSLFWSFYGFELIHITQYLWRFVQLAAVDAYISHKGNLS